MTYVVYNDRKLKINELKNFRKMGEKLCITLITYFKTAFSLFHLPKLAGFWTEIAKQTLLL